MRAKEFTEGKKRKRKKHKIYGMGPYSYYGYYYGNTDGSLEGSADSGGDGGSESKFFKNKFVSKIRNK